MNKGALPGTPGITSLPKGGLMSRFKVMASLLAIGLGGCGEIDGGGSGSPFFLAISGGTEIQVDDPNKYNLPFTVLVTSTEGDPIEGARVNLRAEAQRYRKGNRLWSGAFWAINETATCPNEDVNRNGTLDTGEDYNNDGILWPGNPVAYSPNVETTEEEGAGLTGRVITDSQGFADFTLNYGKDYGQWVEVEITASTAVEGTEDTDQRTIWLSVASEDVSDEGSSPPGNPSPYGEASDCTNPD